MDDQVDATLDNLLVQFGSEILKIVPGRVSTEVDARFSFDTKESVSKALHIIDVGYISTFWRFITNSTSFTKTLVLERSGFSSSLRQHGRGSRLQRSFNQNTESTAT